MFTGQENDSKFLINDDIDIGASGNVVIRLTKNFQIIKTTGCTLITYYYTLVSLMCNLFDRGILSLGRYCSEK